MRVIKNEIYFDKFWLTYFFVRLMYLFIAVFVYSMFTQLGDTNRYLNAGVLFSLGIFIDSTAMMEFLGSVSKFILRIDILANLPFMLLSFFSIKYAVVSLNLKRNRYLLFFLLIMPSFCIWTSVCSKESISVFYTSVLSVYIVRLLKTGRYKPKGIEILAFYLCGLFKAGYLIYILQGILFIFLVRVLKLKRLNIMILSLLFLVLNALVFYVFRDEIDFFSKGMAIYFESDTAQSTRTNAIWVNTYDVFKNAPYAMYISFIGPTLGEMLSNPLHLITGLESYVILIIFIYLLSPTLIGLIKNGKIDFVFLSYILIVFTGVLFIHAFYGALNPGSAVRYRENFYLLFMFLLFNQFNSYYKSRGSRELV